MVGELVENGSDADYRYTLDADGLAVITRCIARDTHITVPARLGGCPVAALGEESFASTVRGGFPAKSFNGDLARVVLPEGLVRIGRAAFRGCRRLATVVLPDSLVEIDDLAFSCTSLEEIELPRSCARLALLALRTGPESLTGAGAPYFSTLDRIDVDSGNPTFCMSGGALCRKLDEGGLEAILCPGTCDELVLAREVVRVSPTAFAGSYEFGRLEFGESIAFVDGCGLAVGASCGVVSIELDTFPSGNVRLELTMPSKALQRRVFESTKDRPAFDLASFLAEYDLAVAEEPDRLLKTKLSVARLAHPLHLDSSMEREFASSATASLDAICLQFGAHGYWRGFDDLLDAGLLDAQAIPPVVDALTKRGDAAAAAYLLEQKRMRFGKGEWDYGL